MLLVVALGQQRASTVETTLAAFVLHHVAFCLCGAYRAALRRGACEAVCSPEASSVFGALRWDTCSILSPLSISRSNPSPITPAVLPPTPYLQLPAPASTSCGSQQLGLCDQGVCKSDTTTLMQVEVLANACAAVSSSKQVRAASARRTLHRHAFLHSRLTSLTLLPPRNLSVSEPHLHFAISNLLPS